MTYSSSSLLREINEGANDINNMSMSYQNNTTSTSTEQEPSKSKPNNSFAVTGSLFKTVKTEQSKPHTGKDMSEVEYIQEVMDPIFRPLIEDMARRMPEKPTEFITQWTKNPPPIL